MVMIASSQLLREVVAGDVAPLADEMGKRIDAERPMIDGDGAPEEADDQPRPARDGEADAASAKAARQLEAMQPHQLGVFGKILHPVEVRVL